MWIGDAATSVTIDWDKWEHILIAVGAAGTIAAFILTPFADRLFIWMLKRSKVEVQNCINGWYREEMRERDETVAGLASLRAQFESHVQSQGKRDEELLKRFQEAMEQQGETLKAIHEEAQATAQSVAHIYGLMNQEPWDGRTDRRRGERRGGD